MHADLVYSHNGYGVTSCFRFTFIEVWRNGQEIPLQWRFARPNQLVGFLLWMLKAAGNIHWPGATCVHVSPQKLDTILCISREQSPHPVDLDTFGTERHERNDHSHCVLTEHCPLLNGQSEWKKKIKSNRKSGPIIVKCRRVYQPFTTSIPTFHFLVFFSFATVVSKSRKAPTLLFTGDEQLGWQTCTPAQILTSNLVVIHELTTVY